MNASSTSAIAQKEMADNKAGQEIIHIHSTSNSTADQRARLLAALRQHPVTTLMARSILDIMHPAARIQELRAHGYVISTVWTIDQAEQGNAHRVAKYALVQESRV